MTRARDLARIVNSNALTVDSSGNVGIGSTVPTSKLSVVGIVSASQVFASGVNLANVASGNITPTSVAISGEGATAVTINSSGINVTGVITATSFYGNATGLSGSPNITVTGVNASGVVTATSFVGSGANLTGISSVSFATTSFGLSGTPAILVSSVGINTTTVNGTKLYLNGNAASNIVTLTDGATITPDFTLGNNFQVTIAATRNLANPTGVTTGQSGVIFIQQNGTGGYSLSYGTSWDFASATPPTLITTANALNALPYFARSTTSIVVGSVISGIGTL